MEVRDGGDQRSEFTSGFDIDEIMEIGWFRFMKEIVSNGYDFVLNALLNLESVKRFECRSDM